MGSFPLVVSHLQRLPSGMALGGGLAISSAWDTHCHTETNLNFKLKPPAGSVQLLSDEHAAPSESLHIIKIEQRKHSTVHLGIALQIRLTAVTTRLKPSVQVVKADHRLLMTPASDAPDCPLSQRAVAPERAAALEPPDSFQPWLALQPPACARLTLW